MEKVEREMSIFMTITIMMVMGERARSGLIGLSSGIATLRSSENISCSRQAGGAYRSTGTARKFTHGSLCDGPALGRGG